MPELQVHDQNTVIPCNLSMVLLMEKMYGRVELFCVLSTVFCISISDLGHTEIIEDICVLCVCLSFDRVKLTLRMRSANILVHRLYMHSAMCQCIGAGEFTHVSSEAKPAFGVNPFLLSSNKCRPHVSTYITCREGRRGSASLRLFEKGHSK